MSFDLRPCRLEDVRELCARYHVYGGAGGSAVYAFGVWEDGRLVAAYAWQPPPPGAARAVCPEAPQCVLALSRMVAVPKNERRLKHVSKPLRVQMKHLIDRGRWPVLITYSDEGAGHTGYVYLCSGWTPTSRRRAPTFVDEHGRRVSRYANGRTGDRTILSTGHTFIQRWEHWACPFGEADKWMESHGWKRVPVPGRVWVSGSPAMTYVRQKHEDSIAVLTKIRAAKGAK